jgi:hypothetical protein
VVKEQVQTVEDAGQRRKLVEEVCRGEDRGRWRLRHGTTWAKLEPCRSKGSARESKLVLEHGAAALSHNRLPAAPTSGVRTWGGSGRWRHGLRIGAGTAVAVGGGS